MNVTATKAVCTFEKIKLQKNAQCNIVMLNILTYSYSWFFR